MNQSDLLPQPREKGEGVNRRDGYLVRQRSLAHSISGRRGDGKAPGPPLDARPLWHLAAFSLALTLLGIVVIDKPLALLLAESKGTGLGDAIYWLGDRLIWLIDWPLMFWLHKWGTVMVLCGAGIVVMAVPRLRKYGAVLLLVIVLHIVCRVFVNYLKEWTCRLRPQGWIANGADQSFWFDSPRAVSFPSGHATIVASLMLPMLLFRRVPGWLRATATAAGFVAGGGRLLQNAHFFSDVTFGVCVCATICALASWPYKWLARFASKAKSLAPSNGAG